MSTETAAASARGARRQPILWFEAEPDRLERDRREVAAFGPLLEYYGPGQHDAIMFPHGGWYGELPKWPFTRARPGGLDALLGPHGLRAMIFYSAAHPMVPPVFHPVDPEPELIEQTQSAWHVAPGGALCLLQSVGGWQPEASITELFAKASGWRIEYALMKAGVIPKMSTSGIVSDGSFDHLISEAVLKLGESPGSADSDAP